MKKNYEVVGISRIQTAKFDGYCYACVGEPFFANQQGHNVEKVFVGKDVVLQLGDYISLLYVKALPFMLRSAIINQMKGDNEYEPFRYYRCFL